MLTESEALTPATGTAAEKAARQTPKPAGRGKAAQYRVTLAAGDGQLAGRGGAALVKSASAVLRPLALIAVPLSPRLAWGTCEG